MDLGHAPRDPAGFQATRGVGGLGREKVTENGQAGVQERSVNPAELGDLGQFGILADGRDIRATASRAF